MGEIQISDIEIDSISLCQLSYTHFGTRYRKQGMIPNWDAEKYLAQKFRLPVPLTIDLVKGL